VSRREVPYINNYFELLLKASYAAAQNSATLDTLGYAHGAKGESAAAMLWNVGTYTSGTWVPTLNESDNFAGPWTAVDPTMYKWYANGFVHPGAVSVSNAGGASQIYVVSYVAGLHRYLQLNVNPNVAGTLVFGVLGLVGFPYETQDRAFTNYPQDLASVVWPTP